MIPAEPLNSDTRQGKPDSLPAPPCTSPARTRKPLSRLPSCLLPSQGTPVRFDSPLGSVHTDVFDGPLELLLFLVRREGVDLRDVAIAPITDAFCEQVELMEAFELDNAGDFLVMAATLCWLKSRELMPRAAGTDASQEDEASEVRDDLARRLAEYQRYREAADRLVERPMLGRDVHAPSPPPVDETVRRPVNPGVDALGLLEVFYGVLSRVKKPQPVHEVTLEHYSIEQMATWILDRLDASPRSLSDLLRLLDNRTDRVVAFLASLEMARLQFLSVEQEGHLTPLVLRSRTSAASADLTALSGTLA